MISRLRPWFACLLLGCARDEAAPAPVAPREIRLVWHQGWDGETWDRARAGLWWSLSNVGAAPPADEEGLRVLSASDTEVVFDLDLDAVGLPAGREDALDLALAPLLASDELALHGAVDLGRALLATLYQPWFYAALAGVCPSYEDFAAARLGEDPAHYVVTDSFLVEGERLLTMRAAPTTLDEIGFVAEEGEGSALNGDFVALEREVVDVMPNGQQRFAVYDMSGALLPAATVAPAGQAGRCQWCHENHIMPIMGADVPVDGALSYDEVSAILTGAQSMLDAARASDTGAVDFETYEVHAWSELLVEAFLHASPARIAQEWGVEADEVEAVMDNAGYQATVNEEYPEFGLLYARADIDAAYAALLPELAGVEDYEPLDVLDSARELAPEDFATLPGERLVAQLAPCAP